MNATARGELDQLSAILQQSADNLAAIDHAANLLHQKAYPLAPALSAYDSFLSRHAKSAIAAYNYAWYLAKDGQFEKAVDLYRRALELGIGQPEEVHLNIANLLMDHLGDNRQAKMELNRALALNPRYAGAYYNLGNLAEQSGDRQQAAGYFEKCLEIEPANQSALARLADTHKFVDADDPMLLRLLQSVKNGRNSDLHFSLGSAFNQLKDFDAAWRHFDQANALENERLPPYSKERTEAFFERVKSVCSKQWLSRFEGTSNNPVFICGMFRTGSTLLEQILAAHPAFAAGGESEFFPRLVLQEFHDFPAGLEQVTPDESKLWRDRHTDYTRRFAGESIRLTDKRPDNFIYAGLISAVLPSARFVITERDWRDVALSIYSTRLGASQNYSTRLENIKHYIEQQERLVNHWETILGDRLIRIRYEDLVARPRETVSSLLRFLGEDWDERCLAFNTLDNTVKTASVWQVRQPLHSKSIGRWKNYRIYFERVFGSALDAQ